MIRVKIPGTEPREEKTNWIRGIIDLGDQNKSGPDFFLYIYHSGILCVQYDNCTQYIGQPVRS